MLTFIVLIILSSVLCWAGEITYFTPDGSVITKEMHETLSKEHRKKVDNIKSAIKKTKIDALQKQTDKHGRPLYDSEGRSISYRFIDAEKEKKQKRIYYQQPVLHLQQYRAYPRQSVQRKDATTQSNNDMYKSELLRIEREKLRILKEREDREWFQYLNDRFGLGRSRQDRRLDRRLDDIEQNTREIKRKLDFGW